MTDTMSLLGWLTAPRDPDSNIQRTITHIGVEKLFRGILHDCLCEARDNPTNPLFALAYTADGEAYIDWTLRTDEDWVRFTTALAIRSVAHDLMRPQKDE